MDDLFQLLRFSPLGFSGDSTNMKFLQKDRFFVKNEKAANNYFSLSDYFFVTKSNKKITPSRLHS